MYPKPYKVVNPECREDNSWTEYFPTTEEAQKECNKRNGLPTNS
jgi:hypothetical protein